jgi:hypothetical protein
MLPIPKDQLQSQYKIISSPQIMNDTSTPIINFGGNVAFTPRHRYTPRTEAELLDILDHHAHGKVRVLGALHSWSPLVASDDALVDMRHFDDVQTEGECVTVGGGCRIKDLLTKLHALGNITMPSLGLITEQTIAGAISTATHGSGRHSLSHYMDEIRVAAFDASGKATIYHWKDGPELRAARCALGCMGIILAVRFRGVPKYGVEEHMAPCATLDAVLAKEEQYPLQQFYFAPHNWTYFAQRRRVVAYHEQRQISALLYRAWWFLSIDVGLHVLIKLLTGVLQSRMLTRFFFRSVLPWTILTNVPIVDHSDEALVMEHELFRHLEIEIFVPARHLSLAADFVRAVLEVFDGAEAAPPTEIAARLDSIGMLEELTQRVGRFTYHYSITFRRVLPDDTLISMTAGATEPYYSISLITYAEPRDRFYELASFLARSMVKLFEARLHWGKYFPLPNADLEGSYPQLAEFRGLCRQVDPHGVFRNEFAQRVLFAL